MGSHFAHKPPGAGPGWLADQVAADGAILLEFVEHAAPTCRLEEPVLASIHNRFGDRAAMVQTDVDGSPEDAARYAVTAVPTFLLFVDGVEKFRRVGYQSVDDLSGALDKALAPPDATTTTTDADD